MTTMINAAKSAPGTPEADYVAQSLGVAGRRPALNERAQAVSDRVGGVFGALDELRQRLEPVLLPSEPTPPGPDAPAAAGSSEPDSWLADFLGTTTSELERLYAAIAVLTGRIDL